MKKKGQRVYNKLNHKPNKKLESSKINPIRDTLNSYGPAIDYLSGYNGNINMLSSQLNHFKFPNHQEPLLNAMSGMQGKLYSLNAFEAMLPKHNFMSPAFDISRDVLLSYTGLSKPLLINDMASFVIPKYPTWHDSVFAKDSLLKMPVFPTFDILKENKSFNEILALQNISAFSVQSSLAKATEYSLFAEKSLSSFPWTGIGSKIGLSDSSKKLIGDSFLSLATNYSELLKSFSNNPESYIELSPSLTRHTPIEYYNSANLLELISTDEEITTEEELLKNEIQYENEYSLNEYLPRVNPGLFNLWKGAVETFHSTNSDKVRQFTVSLRELFGHLMHILAPDDEIKKWTSDSTFYHEGKPTRKARLSYICRNIANKSFNKFVEKDIQATIEFIGIFQEGTHSIETDFKYPQLVAMKSKAEATLKFLLEVEFSANR